MNDRAELTFDLSHAGELSVAARLCSYADLDRFIDSLYHVAFLRWPEEIGAVAAGEDAGDRLAMMRAGADLAANEAGKSDEPAKAPEKPAGAPARAALPSPPASTESATPGAGQAARGYKANPGGRSQPIKIGALEFPSKGKAILHCLRTGRSEADIIRLCDTTSGSIASVKKEARASGELRR